MAQDLTVNIKTTSDVPEAMNKAKAAAGSFDKQVQDIGMKFKTAFKDIALGFIAPMVLLQGAISFISSAIEKAKQDAKDGIDLIARGETIYANAEEKKMAAFFKAKAEREKEMAQVAAGKEQLGRDFSQTPEGAKAMKDFLNMGMNRSLVQVGMGGVVSYEALFKSQAFQDFMVKRFVQTPEGKAYQPIFDKEDTKKDTAFKGPEGFSNVVGVGANPVMEAMTRQLEEQQKQTALLEQIANKGGGGGVPVPFTEAKQFPGHGDQM